MKRIAEKDYVAWGLILLYIIVSLIMYSLADSPWDGDCVTRLIYTQNAFQEPKHFVSLWNRPLFVLIFSIPSLLGKHSILLMLLISTVGIYALYLAAKEKKLKNAWLVIPFLAFQCYFFTISRNALAEPLAACLICLGILFYVRKQFLYFAIAGSLLPLARLELSVLMVFWAIVLIQNRHWRYLFILGVPLVCWSIAGSIIEGGTFWLYDQTIGKENGANRYGHKEFHHYFHRYIYVLGPVVFFYFIVGFIENVIRRKWTLFVTGQLVVGFLLYVIFSWKLNLGQAAGFLRHLITISPLVAWVALEGFNYWWIRFVRYNNDQYEELKVAVSQSKGSGKRKEWERRIQQVKSTHLRLEKLEKSILYSRIRMIAIGVGLAVVAYFYLSKSLLNHHSFSKDDNYVNLIFIATLLVVGGITLFIKPTIRTRPAFMLGLQAFICLGALGFTLDSESNNNTSDERELISDVASFYFETGLDKHPVYVNHNWFFWTSDLKRDKELHKHVTKQNLADAPDSSIIIWDSHYGFRLTGDVPINHFAGKKEYQELTRMYSKSKKTVVMVYQKLSKKATKKDKLAKLNEMIAKAPENAGCYFNRAHLYLYSFARKNDAIADYNKALELDENISEIHDGLGAAYFQLKDYDQAIESYQKLIDKKPDYKSGLFNMGSCYFYQKKYEKAIDSWGKAIKLDSKMEKAYFNRALAYVNLEKTKEAQEDFGKIIKLNPKSGAAYYNRGILYLREKQPDMIKGCKDFKSAVEQNYRAAQKVYDQYCSKVGV